MTVAHACILIAALMPYVFTGIAKWSSAYDNSAPRVFLEGLRGYPQRAHWVQQNSFEMFPAFAAGVLTAHQLGAAEGWVDGLAVAYVVARLAYGAAYLADLATLRSCIWMVALGCVVALFVVGA